MARKDRPYTETSSDEDSDSSHEMKHFSKRQRLESHDSNGLKKKKVKYEDWMNSQSEGSDSE